MSRALEDSPVDVLGQRKPTPRFYSKYTSSTSDREHSLLWADINQVLTKDEDVEFKAYPSKNEIHGVFSKGVEVVEYRISLYASQPSSRTLIEFQRLHGSSSEFSELQKRVMNGIQGHNSRRRGIRGPPSLPRLDDNLNDQSEYETRELNSNLRLAKSDYAEQQREGISVLAAMSMTSTAIFFATNLSELLHAIQLNLDNHDGQSRRSAALLLHNMFQHCEQHPHATDPDQFKKEVCQALSQSMLSIVSELADKSKEESVFSQLVRTQYNRFLATPLSSLQVCCRNHDSECLIRKNPRLVQVFTSLSFTSLC